MSRGYLIGVDPPEVIRTPEYSARMIDLWATSKRAYKLVRRMEDALIAADGYPPDSFFAAQKLRLISNDDWTQLVAIFDQIAPGGAFLALSYIEYQRIMQRGDVAIFYAILHLQQKQRIVLLDLHFQRAPTWGEMMKQIYRLTVARR